MFDLQLEGEFAEIAGLQSTHEEDMFNLANVVAVGVSTKESGGIDTGEPCLTVFVSHKVESEDLLDDMDLIPATLGKGKGKIKTDVIEVGTLFAGGAQSTDMLDTEDVDTQTLRSRIRPAMGGYSVGHPKVTAGTYATAVTDARPYPGIPPRYYILSNNHVLANSNDARLGDAILQPGRYDGGRYPADAIARLSRFVPIRFGGPNNYVDAAIAEGAFHNLNREIYWIGYAKGVSVTKVGQIVQKTGRTTNYTTGKVLAVNATANVNYGGGRVAKMVRQIITTNMSAGGDSGSLLLNMNGDAVGLLFAGSSRVTIHNDIRYVQALLGIRVA